MFRWIKKRKEIKKLKKLRDKIQSTIEAIITLREETIIGEFTETSPIVRNSDFDTVIEIINKTIQEIDSEIEDRTRIREPLFKNIKKDKNNAL